MAAPNAPSKDSPVEEPVGSQSPVNGAQQNREEEVSVEITDIKASGLPPKVGLFSGLFYVSVKGGKNPQRTKTAKYVKGEEFVASWGESLKLSGLESSTVEIEVYARKFFFSYKAIKKTESKQSLADLLEHTATPVELELLEDGHAAGKLVFRISKTGQVSPGAGENATTQSPEDLTNRAVE
ncbi:hypothetical protein BDN67DRAFT_1011098 [Paxillus ammoniavirescens]|nr:hypothetical protein BDN67DRAFT_1011098 [Paxillus ammoniavirescens]